jgi:hypothetical protein
MGMSEKYLVDCIHTIICRNLYNGKCIAVQCEAYMAPSGWISVRTATPKDGQPVIMWVPGGNGSIDGGYIFDGVFIHDYFFTPDGETKNAKYWMPRISPLPSPPKEGG